MHEDIATYDCMPAPQSLAGPRDRYYTKVFQAPRGYLAVQVWSQDQNHLVAEYQRNTPHFSRTFEPFRQGGRDYALVSPVSTATSVLDLLTGKIIATEQPDGNCFCPADYYVPDRNDVVVGVSPKSVPGDQDSACWTQGYFGFVAGKTPGDAGGLRVQFLDLSEIANGVILRSERFGHIELPEKVSLRDAIWMRPGSRVIEIAMRVGINMVTGQALYGPGRLNY